MHIVGFDFCGTLVSRQTLRLVVLNTLLPKKYICILSLNRYSSYCLKILERLLILIIPYSFIKKSISRNAKIIASDFDFELFDSKDSKFIISASSIEIIQAVLEEVDRNCPIIAASLNQSIFLRYIDFFKFPCRGKGKVIWYEKDLRLKEFSLSEFHTDSSEDDYIGAIAVRYIKIPSNLRFNNNDSYS